VARVGGDAAQRLRRGTEQDRVHHRLVVKSDARDRRRDGEHDMKVWHRQQVGLARLQPFGPRQSLALWTVPISTRVVRVTNEPTIGAALDMPPNEAVRHASIAAMTRRSVRPSWAACACRNAAPWR